jgi:cytochrome c5
MKTRILRTLLVAAVLTAACLALGRGDIVPTSAKAAEPARSSNVAQIARGAKLWSQTCNRCHNLRSPSEFSDKDWNVITMHMRVIGPLPGQDVRDIRAFLKASN